MKLIILNKKMIKPCIPTPQNLKNYNISFTDYVTPPINIPIILFYSSPSSSSSPSNEIINHLQQSLASILPRFYPLAGRYIKKDHLVHCNDEGVEFVEARACSDNFSSISDYIRSGKCEQLNNMLLPRLSWEVDEVTDPLVSIQVTTFGCGGLAIGLSISHRIVDADSVSTFVRDWAREANNRSGESRPIVNPSFESPALLPFKGLTTFVLEDAQLPRTIDPEKVAKRFFFNRDAVETLKARITDKSKPMVSKVNVVCALISKAMIRVDQLKHGRTRDFLLALPVNIRNRTIPPFPEGSCGNLVMHAAIKLCCRPPTLHDREPNVGFEDLVLMLRGSIDKTIAGLRNASADEWRAMIGDSAKDLLEALLMGNSSEESTRLFFISDWTKFDFYQADFGWGKPVWTSTSTGDNLANLALLMGNKEGDGIEAWVHLLKEEMLLFEQDEDIIRFDTSKVEECF